MRTVSLADYLDGIGTQADLAKALGIQQSAISQMVRAKRNITVCINADGSMTASETRPIPSRTKTQAA